MTTIEHLVGEFIDDWKSGRRPDLDAYLQRADPRDRDKLGEQIATWLEIAPTPDYDETTRQQIAREPMLVAARDAAELIRRPLAERLPTLRERAGLAISDVAARLTQAFSLGDEARVGRYLEEVERDELDERRLSNRLLDALAGILGADREMLAPRPAAAAPGGQAFFRLQERAETWLPAEIDALSRAALSDAPSEQMDEVDRLFRGGPEG